MLVELNRTQLNKHWESIQNGRMFIALECDYLPRVPKVLTD